MLPLGSDPYCVVRVGAGEVRSRTVAGTLEPRWNAVMDFALTEAESVLSLDFWDEDDYIYIYIYI